MHERWYRALGAAFLFGAVSTLATPIGCGTSSPAKGGLIIGTDTRMQVPKDVSYVSVTVFTNDSVKFNLLARVRPDGTLDLPATLAVIEPDDPNATIRIRLMAFQNTKPRVLHDFRTTVPRSGRIAYLNLPLDYLDDQTVAGDLAPFVTQMPPEFDPTVFTPTLCPDPTETSIDGECKDNFIDSSALPDFKPELVGDAMAPSCFDVAACFAKAKPISVDKATGLDIDACTLHVNGRDLTKLNLALMTPDTGLCLTPGSCFVPLGNDEHGWRVSADTITLPPGACKKYLSKNVVKLYETTGCAPLDSASTICRADTKSMAGGDGGGGDAGKVLPPATGTRTQLVVSTDLPGDMAGFGNGFSVTTPGGWSRLNVLTQTLTPVSPPFGAMGDILRFYDRTGSCPAFATTTGAYVATGSGYTPVTAPAGTTMLGAQCTSSLGAVWLTTTTPYLQQDVKNPFLVAFDPPSNGVTYGELTALSIGSNMYMFGNKAGALIFCPGTAFKCSASATLSATVDNTIQDMFTGQAAGGAGGYRLTVLARDGVYAADSLDTTGMTLPAPKLVKSGDYSGFVDSEGHSRLRTVFASSECAFFTSANGVEWVSSDGTKSGLVASVSFGPKPASFPIVGITADQFEQHIFWTLHAKSADGGGIYVSDVPVECGGPMPGADAGVAAGCVVYGACSIGADCCSGTCNPDKTCKP